MWVYYFSIAVCCWFVCVYSFTAMAVNVLLIGRQDKFDKKRFSSSSAQSKRIFASVVITLLLLYNVRIIVYVCVSYLGEDFDEKGYARTMFSGTRRNPVGLEIGKIHSGHVWIRLQIRVTVGNHIIVVLVEFRAIFGMFVVVVFGRLLTRRVIKTLCIKRKFLLWYIALFLTRSRGIKKSIKKKKKNYNQKSTVVWDSCIIINFSSFFLTSDHAERLCRI